MDSLIPMQALMLIEDLERARVLLSPIRIAILDLLRERASCKEIGRQLAISPQRANNHMRTTI